MQRLFLPAGPVTLLRASRLFQRLSDDELRRVAMLAQPFAAYDGDVLFQEGDRADGLFLVERGVVRVEHPASKELGTLHLLGEGDVVGLSALVEPYVYIATAVVASDAALWQFPRAGLR